MTEGTFSRGVHGAGAKTEFQAGSWRGVGACPPPQGRGGPVPRAGTRLLQSPLLDARPHQAGERYVSPESAVNLPGSREGDRDARDSAGPLPAAAHPPYGHRLLCGPGSGDHGDRADSPRALSVTSATPPLPLPPARQPRPAAGPAHATLGHGAGASGDWTACRFCSVASAPPPPAPRLLVTPGSPSPLTLLRPAPAHQCTLGTRFPARTTRRDEAALSDCGGVRGPQRDGPCADVDRRGPHRSSGSASDQQRMSPGPL